MNALKTGGTLFLVATLAVEKGVHIEMPTFHPEPLPSRPFVELYTFSGITPSLSAYPQPSNIPE